MARYAYTGPERRQGEGWQGTTGLKGRVGTAVSEAKDSVSEAASGVADRAGEFKDRAGEKIGELGGQARVQTRRIKTNLQHQAEQNPYCRRHRRRRGGTDSRARVARHPTGRRSHGFDPRQAGGSGRADR